MGPSCYSLPDSQPLGPRVVRHCMHNFVHHAQTHVASASGERLPTQMADHLCHTTSIMPPVTNVHVSSSSALNHVQLPDVVFCVRVPYRRSIFQMGSDKGLDLHCLGGDSEVSAEEA